MSLTDMKVFKDKFGYGGITPTTCRALRVKNDQANLRNELRWKDPEDTYINGFLISTWAKTVIVRKAGSYPTDIVDGEIVVENRVRNAYTEGFTDDNFQEGDNVADYFYKAFPVADTGAVSNNDLNQFKSIIVYGFKKSMTNLAPDTRIQYTDDAVGMAPARMDFSADTFNYGDWGDTFIMESFTPVMLNTDGTEVYELNKNNYAQKTDGSASDITDSSKAYNAMMRVDLMYTHFSEDADYLYFKVANGKVDDTFRPLGFVDANGNESDRAYLRIYEGSLISNKVRSLSGQTLMNTQTSPNERTYAQNNGSNWNKGTWAHRALINALLQLISCSSDSQTSFGRGHVDATSPNSVSSCLKTGTMNDRGMFWGSSASGKGVKVFGMENWWGNQWERIEGCINVSGKMYLKDHAPYNDTASGYTATGLTPTGTSGGYISKEASTEMGFLPIDASGSGTTGECDGLWFNNGQTDVAVVGGTCDYVLLAGAEALNVHNAASASGWGIGASLSYVPLAA